MVEPGSKGIIFCATGQVYVGLASQAAESVKKWMPDIPVDLFTDLPLESDLFDRVHILSDPWKRSKIDSMIASRFERTIFLDADVIAVDEFYDVFEILENFQLCGAYDQLRNTWNAQKIWRVEVPEAFPQINTGVVGFRHEPEVIALLQEWRSTVRENSFWRDQPIFRELVWLSGLKLAILPDEYNYMGIHTFKAFSSRNPAIRLVHSPRLHNKAPGGDQILGIDSLFSPELLAKMEALRKKRISIVTKKRRRRKNL